MFQIEYLYSIMFMVLGAVLYLPFVHYGYVFRFMDSLTSFLQVPLHSQGYSFQGLFTVAEIVLKGTLSRDFFALVFSLNLFILVLLEMPWGRLEF